MYAIKECSGNYDNYSEIVIGYVETEKEAEEFVEDLKRKLEKTKRIVNKNLDNLEGVYGLLEEIIIVDGLAVEHEKLQAALKFIENNIDIPCESDLHKINKTFYTYEKVNKYGNETETNG